MNHHKSDYQDRVQAWFGTALMFAGSVLAVLIFSDRMKMDLVPLPAVWYSSRPLHLIICGGIFLAAAFLLRSPRLTFQRNGQPLFRSCRLLTRRNCHLCDDALNVLLGFQDAMPTIEVVDIDDNPQLVRQFGESVPVVELDGRIRFRGGINPALLQRLVDAAELRESERQGADAGDITSTGIAAGRR